MGHHDAIIVGDDEEVLEEEPPGTDFLLSGDKSVRRSPKAWIRSPEVLCAG